ncbi:hypothetical protein HN748_02890 [Candidatus Peregrinibacteria bacterium]|jgi:hypothetical protein|nr:hypothetical protein [Candidatus Peregrinibacteria bacterium]MBT7483392.1 hypothetical protein [Candidatus Peregrinibacteria bacterium]MBT7703153.1 hypothetical protein [Candidatus Peregrinibacteria bacterium]
MKKILTKLILALSAASTWVVPAYAAVDPCEDPSGLSADEKLKCLFPEEQELIELSPQATTNQGNVKLPSGHITEDFLPFFINTALSLAGTLVFIAILYAGYLLVVANDNEEEISKAKRILVYCMIGIAVIAGSYAIIFGVATLDLD